MITLGLAWLSAKYDIEPLLLYVGTVFADWGLIQVLINATECL